MLGSLFRSERRAIQATAWGEWGDSGATWAGPNVSASSSLQLLSVFGCNQFICHGVATMPVGSFRKVDKVSVDAPKPPWLEEPMPDVDPIAWETQQLTSLLLAGNSYMHKDYDGTPGGPRYLTPLDPTKVSVKRIRGRKSFLIDGKEFTTADILHTPSTMFPGSDVGLSPVEYARQMIGAGLSAEETAARYFGQGMQLPGVIEDPQSGDSDKAREIAKMWGKSHSGPKNSHRPGVLMGGATWKPTGVTNEQAQFLETRGFTAAQIASFMFLIDPSEFALFMGQGGSITYANLEQRNSRKVQVTFMPWIVRLEKAWSSLLPKPRYVKINPDGLLRGDTLARYQAYSIGIQNEFLVPNEPRRLEDLPPLDGGDEVISDPAPGGAPPGGAK